MKKRARIVSGLAVLGALFLAPLAEASLTRATSPALEAPALTLTSPAPEPSAFSLFEGNELTAAAAEPERTPGFHPLAAVSLLDERVQRELVTPQPSYPKTRYRVFGLLGTPILGELRGVSLELHWRSASFNCGLSSGTVGFLQEDPEDDRESLNLYAFVGMRPNELTDPMGLLGLGDWLGVAGNAVSGTVSDTLGLLSNPLVAGSLQALAGVAEVVAGTAGLLAPEPTGATKVFGAVALVHGIDDIAAGLKTAISGKQTDTLTKRGIQKGLEVIVSADTADKIATGVDLGIGIFAPMGALKGAGAARGAVAAEGAETRITNKLATAEREGAELAAGETRLGKTVNAALREDSAVAREARAVSGEASESGPTLREVNQQIGRNANNALRRAERRGLSGADGGNYADAQFNRLNTAYNKRLRGQGSAYEVQVQPARDVAGNPVPARTASGAYTPGSKRLDATVVERSSGKVQTGYDITISKTKWNRPADNSEYQRRFGIPKVNEINPNGPRQ